MPPQTTRSGASDDPPNTKVARLIDSYGLGDEFGDRLERLWTADEDRRMSLRDLADLVNERLLEVAMSEAGMKPIEGEVENLYRLLTDDDVSSGNRTEARRHLEQNDVDVDQLKRDFVTYQAVRSYLQKYRGVTYEDENRADRPERVIQTIQRLQARTQSVAEKNIDQLGGSDDLSIGEYRVSTDMNVFCEDCNTQYGVSELIRSGGCDCERE